MVSKRERWAISNESQEHLRLQWRVGPLGGHRGCTRASSSTVSERFAAEPKAGRGLSHFTRGGGLNRCGSVSCRPGDPYGCSMIEARLHASKTALILDRWMNAGHGAYLGFFELTGVPGVPLTRVMQAGVAAMKESFGGKSWNDSVVEFGVGGNIRTLSVARTAAGSWILRRWVVLGVAEAIDDVGVENLTTGVSGRWQRSLAASDDIESRRSKGFRWISRGEVPTIASFVTGAQASLDAKGAIFSESLALEFSIDRAETTPETLAEQYRLNSSPVGEEFALDDYRHEGQDVRIGLELRHSEETGYRFGVGLYERETYTTAKGEVKKRRKKDGLFRQIRLDRKSVV